MDRSKPLLIEKDDIKFPTFHFLSQEHQIKSLISSESFLIELQHCDELLSVILKPVEVLTPLMNHLSRKMNQLLLHYKAITLIGSIDLFFFRRFIHFLYRAVKLSLSTDSNSPSQDVFSPQEEDVIALEASIENNSQPKEDKDIIFNEILISKAKEKEYITLMLSHPSNYHSGLSSYSICFQILNDTFTKVIQLQKRFNSNRANEVIEEKELIDYLNYFNQIKIFYSFIGYFYSISRESLFNQPESSDTWLMIKTHFKRVEVCSKKVLNKRLKAIGEMISIGYASISKSHEQFEAGLLLKASHRLFMGYYFFNRSKATVQSKKYLIQPNISVSKEIWSFMEQKEVKNALKLVLPQINYSKKWYVRRTADEVTIEHLNSLTQAIELPKEIIDDDSLLIEQSESLAHTLIEKLPKRNKEDERRKYVRVKILHKYSLALNGKEGMIGLWSCCSASIKNNTRNALIIHIHGGGFIAMSPSSHENYTRTWANTLGVPVLSIDYRLSPEFPFPKALDDVYQVYFWVISCFASIFNVSLHSIILIGDSAGGNLALSLTYLLLVKGLRCPSALFLIYPALKLCITEPSPSYLNCLGDQLLEFNLLQYCLEAYSKDNCNGKDPFMSPFYMNDQVVSRLPSVRIFAGSADPLRDDSVLFLERLVKLNVDVEMIEVKDFPHAFLNYDLPLMMPEAGKVNEMIVNAMQKFI